MPSRMQGGKKIHPGERRLKWAESGASLPWAIAFNHCQTPLGSDAEGRGATKLIHLAVVSFLFLNELTAFRAPKSKSLRGAEQIVGKQIPASRLPAPRQAAALAGHHCLAPGEMLPVEPLVVPSFVVYFCASKLPTENTELQS